MPLMTAGNLMPDMVDICLVGVGAHLLAGRLAFNKDGAFA